MAHKKGLLITLQLDSNSPTIYTTKKIFIDYEVVKKFGVRRSFRNALKNLVEETEETFDNYFVDRINKENN